ALDMEPGRQPVLQRRGNQDMGVAELHETGALGVFHDAALERNGAQLIGRSATGPHGGVLRFLENAVLCKQGTLKRQEAYGGPHSVVCEPARRKRLMLQRGGFKPARIAIALVTAVRARFVPGAGPGNSRVRCLAPQGFAPNGIKMNYAQPASPMDSSGFRDASADPASRLRGNERSPWL